MFKADDLYADNYKKLKEKLKEEGKKRVFTFAEDEFIRKNRHLSNNYIGLGLKLPASVIKSRRQILGLVRTKKEKQEVKPVLIIWNNRETYDTDCAKYNLTKA